MLARDIIANCPEVTVLATSREPLSIDGELTLHGATAPVTVTVDARWNGDAIEVAGSAPIVLADFDIEPPDIPGLAKADDQGAFEILLLFERGAPAE